MMEVINVTLPLSIDECLQLLEKETADFERELQMRQLEIVMRLKQSDCGLISDQIIIEIANALMTIVKVRLHGPESLTCNRYKINYPDYLHFVEAKY